MRKIYLLHATTKSVFTAFSLLVLLLTSFGSLGQGEVVLTTASASPWTVPCGVTEITVHLWGGGGGGGGSTSTSGGGGGGASGCYVTQVISVVPGQSFTFSVGTGGTTGTGAGGNGNQTTFGGLIAAGGAGGSAGPSGSGGAVPLGCSGNPGMSGTATTGGAGGNAVSGGSGGASVTGNVNGNPGSIPGGGGSGGGYKGGGNQSGGSGGAGQITIQWTPVSAGTDLSLPTCATSFNLAAEAATAPETGTWTVSPAGPTFSSNTDPTATVSNLTLGTTYTFTWTISGTGCTPSTDQITVVASLPKANAGFDQSLCTGSYTMDANTPETGFTGTWTVISGAVTVDSPNVENSNVTSSLTSGSCATLRWTVTNGSCSNTDDIVICNPTVCNDDPCGAVTIPLNASCISQTFNGATTNSTTSTNPPPPGCGNFGAFSTNRLDVWYAVGPIPADGTLNFTISGLSGDYVNAAIYEGADCNKIDLRSCHNNITSGGTLNITETNLTPGETVYIRIWDYYNSTPIDVSICAFTSSNNSDILPGDNVIACGSSSSFYDTGGSTGSYANNQNVVYTICPDDPNQFVTVAFSSMTMANSLDHMIVLDGGETNSPAIADFYFGTPTFTASQPGGCLTFIFQSNGTSVAAGWNATVSCSATAGTNDITAHCNEQNCLGGCMRTLCGIPAEVTFTGDGFDYQELNESNNGCWTSGERCSNWFFINPETAGTLTMNMYVNNGQDQDFAIWEGFAPQLDCPALTGDDPIMCNFAGATSQGTGFNSALSASNPAYEDDIVITQNDINNGIYFIMVIQTYSNGASCPQPTVDISFGGTASLGCESPVTPGISLDVELLEFHATKDVSRNNLYWRSSSETNNDYYTLEHSTDGRVWEIVKQVDGAGNSTQELYYSVNHYDVPAVINYYRLSQTDYDGSTEELGVKAVDNRDNKVVVKIVNTIGQEVNPSTHKGILIYYFEDGTIEKRYNH